MRRQGYKAVRGRKRPFRPLVWGAGVLLLSTLSFFYLGRSEFLGVARRTVKLLVDHPYFSVREIRVTGGKKVGGTEIIAMAGLRRGMNIWKISPRSIEARVKRHPWVKRVVVRREFPQRVVIEIEEWQARGILVEGRLYYANAEGTIFKEVAEGEEVDFPLITGLRWGDVVSQSRSTRKKIAEALRFAGRLEKGPLTLSEIHFTPGGEIVVYPISYPVALHMGWGGWSDKVSRLRRVLAEWRGKEDHLASLDLSFRDQVVARLREGV